jgi:hypothetical protein
LTACLLALRQAGSMFAPQSSAQRRLFKEQQGGLLRPSAANLVGKVRTGTESPSSTTQHEDCRARDTPEYPSDDACPGADEKP